jgi:hypothetical protein
MEGLGVFDEGVQGTVMVYTRGVMIAGGKVEEIDLNEEGVGGRVMVFGIFERKMEIRLLERWFGRCGIFL